MDGRSVFFFQAEDGIRDIGVTGVQTCALPISGEPGLEPLENEPLEQLPVPSQRHAPLVVVVAAVERVAPRPRTTEPAVLALDRSAEGAAPPVQIGRASCRERV